MPPSIRGGATYVSAIGAAGKISQDSRMTLDPTPGIYSSGAHLFARRDAENRQQSLTIRFCLLHRPLNGLNEAKRLNGWNNLNGHRYCLARGISCILEWLFHTEKTRSKPLDRAIYTIFYRRINGLRWSDLLPAGPSHFLSPQDFRPRAALSPASQ